MGDTEAAHSIGGRAAGPDIFLLTGVGVVQTDLRTGRFKRANKVFCELLGYTEGELQRLTYEDITHPDDRARDAAAFQALARAAASQQAPLESSSVSRCVRKDGAVLWLRLSVTVLPGEPPSNITVVHDLTEQRQTEAALRTSEARYRALFNSIDEGFCVIEVLFDATGKPVDYLFLETNPMFEQHTGVQNLVGKTARELTPELEPYWFEIYGRVATTGEGVRFTDEAKTLGRWFEGYAFRIGEPEAHRVAVLFTDVTHRKQTEAALKALNETLEQRVAERTEALARSEKKFRALVEASAQAVWTADAEGSVDGESPSWCAFTGQTEAERRGWGWLDAVHPDDLEHVTAGWDNDLRTLVPSDTEFRVRHRSGAWRWMTARAVPLFHEDGTVHGWVGMNRDIDVQKRALEALRESEERFYTAFHAGPVAACITTLATRQFVNVNDAFLALTGFTREEVLGRSAHELGLWVAPKRPAERGLHHDPEGEGPPRDAFRNLELQLRTKAGEVRDILISGEVIHVGGERGQLKLFYDVTERKQTEEQLHRALQEVMSDTAWFSSQVLARLAQVRSGSRVGEPLTELSKRERQVLERLAQGKNNDAIADDLGLAAQTVRNYISTVYDKLGVRTRAEAVVWARERGILG